MSLVSIVTKIRDWAENARKSGRNNPELEHMAEALDTFILSDGDIDHDDDDHDFWLEGDLAPYDPDDQSFWTQPSFQPSRPEHTTQWESNHFSMRSLNRTAGKDDLLQIIGAAMRAGDPSMANFFSSLGAHDAQDRSRLAKDIANDPAQRREMIDVLRRTGGFYHDGEFSSLTSYSLGVEQYSQNISAEAHMQAEDVQVSRMRLLSSVHPMAWPLDRSEGGSNAYPAALKHIGANLDEPAFEPALLIDDAPATFRAIPRIAMIDAEVSVVFKSEAEALNAATQYIKNVADRGHDPSMFQLMDEAQMLDLPAVPLDLRDSPILLSVDKTGDALMLQFQAPPADSPNQTHATEFSGFQAAIMEPGQTLDVRKMTGALPLSSMAVEMAQERFDLKERSWEMDVGEAQKKPDTVFIGRVAERLIKPHWDESWTPQDVESVLKDLKDEDIHNQRADNHDSNRRLRFKVDMIKAGADLHFANEAEEPTGRLAALHESIGHIMENPQLAKSYWEPEDGEEIMPDQKSSNIGIAIDAEIEETYGTQAVSENGNDQDNRHLSFAP